MVGNKWATLAASGSSGKRIGVCHNTAATAIVWIWRSIFPFCLQPGAGDMDKTMTGDSGDKTRATPQLYYDRFMFDEVIDEYYGHCDFHNFGLWSQGVDSPAAACRELVSKLVSLSPRTPRRLLEVGCGKGATTRELRSHWPSAEIVAIDVSEKQLYTCRQNCPTATFQLMDACAMDFRDCSFDLVISVEAAFHFQSRRKFFADARRVLKPGGGLLLQDVLHHKHDDPSQHSEAPSDVILDPGKIIPSENYLAGPDNYKGQLMEAGFDVIKIIDVTEEGPRRFYEDFIKHLSNRERWQGFNSDHVRSLRIGARLFARRIHFCLLVYAVALPQAR